MKTKNTNPWEPIALFFLGLVVTVTILGLLMLWYNHLWFQVPLSFWQYLVLAIAGFIVAKIYLVRWLLPLFFGAAVITQALAWIGMLTLPLLK